MAIMSLCGFEAGEPEDLTMPELEPWPLPDRGVFVFEDGKWYRVEKNEAGEVVYVATEKPRGFDAWNPCDAPPL